MKSAFAHLWAASPATLRRDPSNSEQIGGIPCGPFDVAMWNELFYRLSLHDAELQSILSFGGITPAEYDQAQVAKAIQRGSMNFAVDTGTANAIVATFSPLPSDLPYGFTYGERVWIQKGAAANTGPVTINTATLTWPDSSPLAAGDLPANSIFAAAFNGVGFHLLTVVGPSVFARKVSAGGLGQLVNTYAFSAAGTFTYYPSAGVTSVIARVLAGGGSGAGAPATSSTQVSAGSGGNAGSFGIGHYAVTGPETVIVGAGGVGASGAAGNNGGSSSFGSHLTSPGGAAGQIGAATTVLPFGVGGVTQAASTGGNTLNAQGMPGGLSLGIATNNGGYGGPGGVGPFGGGSAPVAANANGNNATGPGCGGAGTCNCGTSSARTGGNGTDGLVIIEEYAG